MLNSYPNFWINCGQKKSTLYELTTFLALYYDKTYKYIVNKMMYQY